VSNQNLVLEHIDQISGSPAHFPAIKAWVEVVDAGHGDGDVLSINWDDQVTVLKDGDRIVALMVWRYLKYMREAWVCVGWVDEKYRRQGLYKQLYAAMKEQAIKLGARFIGGGVRPSNTAIRASAKSLGRSEHGITLREVIGG
jgi:ribosomal protein S18 acetylase RimI-like enzyme